MRGITFNDVIRNNCRTFCGMDSVVVARRIKYIPTNEAGGGTFSVEIDIVVVAGLAHEITILDQDIRFPREDSLADVQELAERNGG